MKQKISDKGYKYDPEYQILDPIIDFLLDNVNEVDTEMRWISNSSGWICTMTYPIDFELIRANFDLPASIRLMDEFESIDYCLGTAVIRQKPEIDPETGRPILHH